MSGTLDAMPAEFHVPEDWTIYGDPCPCCGGEGDYDESWDPDSGDEWGWWSHATVIDQCTWAPDDDGPCPRWPHVQDVLGSCPRCGGIVLARTLDPVYSCSACPWSSNERPAAHYDRSPDA
jgi:ribosomal protein S27AE